MERAPSQAVMRVPVQAVPSEKWAVTQESVDSIEERAFEYYS